MKSPIPTFCLAAAAMLAASQAYAASLNKTYSYFSIGGSTLEEIQNELAKRGPHVESTGARHPGATRMEFNSRIGYQQTESGCRIASANVTVKANVILPRWRPQKNADADVRFIWATLASDIKRHEESHVSIAKRHARMLEDQILTIGRQKSCEAAAAKAEKLSEKELARHDDEQQRFDRIEGKNFERRLMSLLKYRMEQKASGLR
jgi:predicted secreted Zn-dependent protease